VIYYDFQSNEVIYRQINPIIYYILKGLNKKKSMESLLKKLCKENEIDFKEAKGVLKGVFKELYSLKIFI